jgi:hypothetical protein
MNVTNFPAGKYYIGDLWYVLAPIWNEICDDTPGHHQLQVDNMVYEYWWQYTAHGDGTYFDNQGRCYDVDAGLIGIVAVRDDINYVMGGNIVTFTEQVTCCVVDNEFRFISKDTLPIIIHTDTPV